MSYSVICPSCGEKNIGSSFYCAKCQANLIRIPRQKDSHLEHEKGFQQEATTSSKEKEPKVENLSRIIWHFVRNTLLVNLLILIITILVCGMIGWHTPNEIGLGFIIGGVLAIFIGGASMAGYPRVSRDSNFQTVTPNAYQERRKQNLLDMNDRSGLWVLLGTAGLLAILVGWLVQKFYS